MKLAFSITIICSLLFLGCSQKIRIPKSDAFFEIKTTACYGECPVYEMKIWRNGIAQFEGTDFVEKKGNWIGQIEPHQLDSLKNLLKESNFFQLNDEYDNPGISDFSSTYLSYNLGNQVKKIHCRYDIPEILKKIIRSADLIRTNGNWKKAD